MATHMQPCDDRDGRISGSWSCHPTPCSVRHSISGEQGEEQQNKSLNVLLWPPYTHTYLPPSLSLSPVSVCLSLSLYLYLPASVCLSVPVFTCLCLSVPVCAYLCLPLPVSACLCLSLSLSACFFLSLSLSPQAPPRKNNKVYF